MSESIQIQCGNCQGLLKLKEVPTVEEGECLYCSHLIDLRSYMVPKVEEEPLPKKIGFKRKEASSNKELKELRSQLEAQAKSNQALELQLKNNAEALSSQKELIEGLQNQLEVSKYNSEQLTAYSKELEKFREDLESTRLRLESREKDFLEEQNKFQKEKELQTAEKVAAKVPLEKKTSKEEQKLPTTETAPQGKLPAVEEKPFKVIDPIGFKATGAPAFKVSDKSISEPEPAVKDKQAELLDTPPEVTPRQFRSKFKVLKPEIESDKDLQFSDPSKSKLEAPEISSEEEVSQKEELEITSPAKKSRIVNFKKYLVLVFILGSLVAALIVFNSKRAVGSEEGTTKGQIDSSQKELSKVSKLPTKPINVAEPILQKSSDPSPVNQRVEEEVQKAVIAKPTININQFLKKSASEDEVKEFSPFSEDLNPAGEVGVLPKAVFQTN